MAIAGFCSQCGANVYLDANWGCTRGHAWNAISGWYDTDTGVAVTPPWLQPAAPQAAAASSAPAQLADHPQWAANSTPAPTPAFHAEPAPAPAPPPDPAVQLRKLLRDRLEHLNLAVTEHGGVYSASRGDEYECAVAVDGTNGRVVFWEQLRAGRDPGVRDAVRAIAGVNWTVKMALRRDGVAG